MQRTSASVRHGLVSELETLGSYCPRAIMHPPWLIFYWPLKEAPWRRGPWRTGWEDRPQEGLAMAGGQGSTEGRRKVIKARKGGRAEGRKEGRTSQVNFCKHVGTIYKQEILFNKYSHAVSSVHKVSACHCKTKVRKQHWPYASIRQTL